MRICMITIATAWLLGSTAFGQELKLTPEGIPEGHMIIEGDIVVPEDFYEQRSSYATNLWPNGVVPYVFDANMDATMQTAALNAMGLWEDAATISFVPRTSQSAYVRFRDSTGNNSSVGRVGTEQIINIVSWGSVIIIAHEIGHTLGYWHEQSRLDRDIYVSIGWDNIIEGKAHNFNMRSGSGGDYGPYDFESSMHYSRCSFTCCNDPNACGVIPCDSDPNRCYTISMQPGYEAYQNVIGQRSYLSYWDMRTMSFLYPESDWIFVDHTYGGTESGTFLEPYDNFWDGYNNVSVGGMFWVLRPGTFSTGGTLSKACRIGAGMGGVILTN